MIIQQFLLCEFTISEQLYNSDIGFINDNQICTNTISKQNITVNRNYLIRIYHMTIQQFLLYGSTIHEQRGYEYRYNMLISIFEKVTTLDYSKRLQYSHLYDIQMTI
jgi:hypothetical protein